MLFSKVSDRKILCLTAWRRLPESPGWPEKYKNVKMCPNNMTFHTDKDLKPNNFRRKKAKEIDSKRKFEIKAKKCQLEKGLFLLVSLIQAVVFKTLRLFSKIFLYLKNIRTLKTSSRDKWGAGSFRLAKGPVVLEGQ